MSRFQGELILAMAYGYEVHEENDKMLGASKEMSRFGSERFLPGALLVNDLPFRMYLNLCTTWSTQHIPFSSPHP
jgi:hypothetical protein